MSLHVRTKSLRDAASLEEFGLKLLLSDTPGHLVARFDGSLLDPDDTDQFIVHVTPEDFAPTLTGATGLGFHLKPQPGSDLDTVVIRDGQGGTVSSRFSNPDLLNDRA